jgi:hypothetical protein
MKTKGFAEEKEETGEGRTNAEGKGWGREEKDNIEDKNNRYTRNMRDIREKKQR